MNKIMSVYRRVGSVTISASLRDRLKDHLDELGEQYTEQWDEKNDVYVVSRKEIEE